VNTKAFAAFLLILKVFLPAEAFGGAEIVISVDGATLRLQREDGRRVFPIGVGRVGPMRRTRSPVGTWRTGTDPTDRRFYLPHRQKPAFHRGLPFLRLDIPRRHQGEAVQPFGIHGPVTPSLIWGQVSAGCIRMREADIRELFAYAQMHPGLSVRVIRGPDVVQGVALKPDALGVRGGGAARLDPHCPEARMGVRRLERIRVGQTVPYRICGGVDHWFGVELVGGDVIHVELRHRGGLRVELYGIRGISIVAGGRSGFTHRVPLARNNRGLRYLRVVASSTVAPVPYTLLLRGL